MTKKNARQIPLPRSIKRLFPNVTVALDADKAIDISVSRKDCKEAKKLNPSECALARAARRELHADGVIVGLSTSYVIKDNTAVRFQTPERVQREIVSFDRHQDFSPGEYRLIPKPPTAKLGTGHHRPKNGGGKNKNATRKVHHSARVRILPTGAE